MLDLGTLSLSPQQALGIPVALVGSVFLALGTQFQHRGVTKVDAGTPRERKNGLRIDQLFALIRRPSWVIGTIMLALAIVLQLLSLYLAPLTVVQPLGAVALVITSLVNARVNGVKLNRLTIRAIAFCVGGVGVFVAVAALTTSSKPIQDTQLIIVLTILAVVLAATAVFFLLFRKRFTMIFYIVSAGILFGFVATIAKVEIDRIHTLFLDHFHLQPGDFLTIVLLLGLVAAGLLGSYFVQTAHSSGPPDLVVAGLTVIDPMVGVTIGITVLGEASGAPTWAAVLFVLSGELAVYGVFQLARHHPQLRD